jgi:hypothetical protein
MRFPLVTASYALTSLHRRLRDLLLKLSPPLAGGGRGRGQLNRGHAAFSVLHPQDHPGCGIKLRYDTASEPGLDSNQTAFIA